MGDLIIADWHDIENNVASEVHVKRFKVTHSVKPFATRESRASTWERRPPLWARRGVTLCDAQGVDSLQEEGGVADSY